MWKRTALIGLVLVGGAAVGACNDGYGYSGVSVGYADAWDPYYGGFRADPYWGWYGGYYYPGSGIYVYDRDHHRHRWDGATRDYWRGRSGAWRDARRDMRPVWNDYGNHPRSSAPNGGHRGDGRHPR